jgi:CO dehydrogenase maturation factor
MNTHGNERKSGDTIVVTLSGKGGVGKTTITALLLDELARQGYSGRILAVDGDPAMTLHLSLGFPQPATTLADVRENTPLNARAIRNLPTGMTPGQHVQRRLKEAGVITKHPLREITLDVMAMGQREGHGCYCAINNALSEALESILGDYDLIVIDNEAGLEHLNRYRLKKVDLFLVVATPAVSAMSVAMRIRETAESVGMQIGETGTIINRLSNGWQYENPLAVMRNSEQVPAMDLRGDPVIDLPDDDPARTALRPVVEKILCA